ncbi:MAG: tetratricopeptide repeat protein [Planctomycetota bacterium]|nr:tetratricopeptide repeat protein [Planctomycetota bacterium]
MPDERDISDGSGQKKIPPGLSVTQRIRRLRFEGFGDVGRLIGGKPRAGDGMPIPARSAEVPPVPPEPGHPRAAGDGGPPAAMPAAAPSAGVPPAGTQQAGTLPGESPQVEAQPPAAPPPPAPPSVALPSATPPGEALHQDVSGAAEAAGGSPGERPSGGLSGAAAPVVGMEAAGAPRAAETLPPGPVEQLPGRESDSGASPPSSVALTPTRIPARRSPADGGAGSAVSRSSSPVPPHPAGREPAAQFPTRFLGAAESTGAAGRMTPSPSSPHLSPTVRREPGDGSAAASPAGERSDTSFLGREWLPGKEIEGQYVVQGVIGRGGMGVVYKCLDLARYEPVAVKSPAAAIAHSDNLKRRFMREAETWVGLGWHPNIVRAYRVMEFEWLPRIVLEYVDGGSLDEMLEQRPGGLDIVQGLDIAIQICWGMAFAHDRGIVHRDLKPHNVLIAGDGTAKVTDLGLVRLPGQQETKDEDEPESRAVVAPAGSVLTRDGALGTPAYMAPEQWEAASRVGPQADIYAFGVMLYEIFCGRRPFEVPPDRSGTRTDHRFAFYREMHTRGAPPDPVEFRRELDRDLRGIMLRCLRKDPRDRPPGFRAIGEELSRVYEWMAGKRARSEPAAAEMDRRARLDQAWSLVSLGLGCRFRGDLERALQFFSRAIAAFRALDEERAVAGCLVNMGIVHQDRGELDRALVMFHKSLETRGKLNDLAGMSRCHTNIGAIYQARGDAAKALDHYARSLKLKKDIGDREGMGKCYTNIGSIYRARGEWERALGMYELGLLIAERVGNRAEMGSCYNNMGIVYKEMGDHERALDMYEISLEIANDLGDLSGVARCLVNIGILLEEGMKRPEDALRLYEEALRRMRELNLPVPGGLPARIDKLRASLSLSDRQAG